MSRPIIIDRFVVCNRYRDCRKRRSADFAEYKATLAGFNVMFFGDFHKCCEKIALSLETNVAVNFFHKIARNCVKIANCFANIFSENFPQIITLVPAPDRFSKL
jgi:hypothetical protein